jgi:hypothetical protein
MAKTLFDYPVSFPFGATSAPYSPSHPHSGEDRAAPSGTPIVVSGTQLGVVGATGKVTGPHTHIQKATSTTNFISPTGGGGNVTGTVSEVGYNTEIGNFVRIKGDDGFRWSYFHMRDKPLVKVGDKIVADKITKEQEITCAQMQTGSNPGKDYNYQFTGKDLTQANLDKMLQFWSTQPRPATPGYTKVTDLYYKVS